MLVRTAVRSEDNPRKKSAGQIFALIYWEAMDREELGTGPVGFEPKRETPSPASVEGVAHYWPVHSGR